MSSLWGVWGAKRAMLQPMNQLKDDVDRYLLQYSQLPHLCDCQKGLKALHVGFTAIYAETDEKVWLDAYILPPMIQLTAVEDCVCGSKTLNFLLRMDRCVWEKSVKGASSIFAANLMSSMMDNMLVLEADHSHGIVMRNFNERRRNDDNITVAEMCAGGYAGWNHAMKVCESLGTSLKHVCAVEYDQDIADVYCKTWRKAKQCHNLKEFHETSMDFAYPLFICDLQMGWWLSCMADVDLDLMELSSPCQPWSSASMSKGLFVQEGWTSLSSLVVAAYMKPRAIAWEQVSSIRNHKHWPLLMKVAKKCGFELVFEIKANLLSVAPQQRDRLLMVFKQIAIDCDDRRFAFEFPKFDFRTLASFNAIQKMLGDFEDDTKITSNVLDFYLNEKLLPGQHDGKKQKIDVMSYRLRTPNDAAGCIMASYTNQHNIDISLLREKGLYGCLLHINGRIRFFTGPECATLMVPCVEFFMPSSRRLCMKIIGNSIATPHAAFIIAVSLSVISKGQYPCNNPSQLVFEVMKRRMHFGNSDVIMVDGGWVFARRSELQMYQTSLPLQIRIPPTQSEDALVETIITSGGWTIRGLADTELEARQIVHAFGIAENSISSIRRVTDKHVIVMKQPFMTPIMQINWHDSKSMHIMVVLHDKFVIIKRRDIRLIAEVFDFLVANISIRLEDYVITNVVGKKLDHQSEAVPVCMLIKGDIEDKKTWHGELPRFTKKAGVVSAEIPHGCYQAFVCALKSFGIDQFCAAWGWKIHISTPELQHEKVIIHFRREPAPFVTTTEVFHDLLIFWIMRMKFPSQGTLGNTLPVAIKFYGTVLWCGLMDPNSTVMMVNSIWDQTLNAFGMNHEIRAVVHGKWKMHDEMLVDLFHDRIARSKIHWVLPSWGGGQKDEVKLLAKNKLAGIMLSQGVEFQDVADFTEKIGSTIAPGKLMHELSLMNKPNGWHLLKEWFASLGHSIPEGNKKLEKAAMKIQQAVRKKGNFTPQRVDSSQISILADHFLRDDLTPAVILKNIIGAKSGIALIDPSEAEPWVNADKTVSKEPLACIVIGHTCPCQDPSKCTKITVPVEDAQKHPSIIAGCLHQLGDRHIIVPDSDKVHIPLEKSVIMSFTIFRDECDRQLWDSVLNNPVKTVIQILRDAFEKDFLASGPWGRSWRDEKNPSKAHDATSFQFHARVKECMVDEVLQASGRFPVYTTPKCEGKGLMPGWAVVWVKSTKKEAIVEIPKMDVVHFGLVRASKGLGVRVKQGEFEKAFKHLRPSDKAPPSVAARYLYRLQPLPLGCTPEQIQDLTESHKWKIRPVRALGQSTWLVASEVLAPSTWLSCNGKLVLVKLVEQAQQRAPPTVLAGRIAIDSQDQNNEASHKTDPWMSSQNDPWGKYNPKSIGSQSHAVDTQRSKVNHSLADPSLAKKLQDQDDKINVLQSSIADLQKAQTKTDSETKASQKDIDQKLKAIRHDVTDQMNHMSNQFSQSLKSALEKQDSQINAGFAELKSLFLQTKESNESAPKKHKPNLGKGQSKKEGGGISDTEMGASPSKEL